MHPSDRDNPLLSAQSKVDILYYSPVRARVALYEKRLLQFTLRDTSLLVRVTSMRIIKPNGPVLTSRQAVFSIPL